MSRRSVWVGSRRWTAPPAARQFSGSSSSSTVVARATILGGAIPHPHPHHTQFNSSSSSSSSRLLSRSYNSVGVAGSRTPVLPLTTTKTTPPSISALFGDFQSHGPSFSSSSNNNNNDNSTTFTGTVKFYLREKGFGFVVADGRGDVDLFTHRSAIHCSIPLSQEVLDSTVRYPYLKQNERVRFRVRRDPTSGMDQAVDVTWLNGDPIPPERTNYLGGVYERAKRIFGEAVFDYIQDGGKDIYEIKKAHTIAMRTMEQGNLIVQQLGMTVADFPTIKSSQGRGRYLFTAEAAAALEAASAATTTTGANRVPSIVHNSLGNENRTNDPESPHIGDDDDIVDDDDDYDTGDDDKDEDDTGEDDKSDDNNTNNDTTTFVHTEVTEKPN